jgi:excisionase family DNA binding protein
MKANQIHNVQLLAAEDEKTMHPQPKVLTLGELAEYLRVHPSTLYRLLKKGQLPSFKIGSDWRFNVEAIDEWCMKQRGAVSEISPDEAESRQ